MIVAGFGFRKDATAESLHDALSRALAALYPDAASAPVSVSASASGAGAGRGTPSVDRTEAPVASAHGGVVGGPGGRSEDRARQKRPSDARAVDDMAATSRRRTDSPLHDGKPAITLRTAHGTGLPTCPDLLTTAQSKADSPAMQALARRLSRPLYGVPADVLAAQATVTQSPAAHAAHATGSVAEAAALAAAGRGAHLLAPRTISGDRKATCALARGGASACEAMGADGAARPPTNPEGIP